MAPGSTSGAGAYQALVSIRLKPACSRPRVVTVRVHEGAMFSSGLKDPISLASGATGGEPSTPRRQLQLFWYAGNTVKRSLLPACHVKRTLTSLFGLGRSAGRVRSGV